MTLRIRFARTAPSLRLSLLAALLVTGAACDHLQALTDVADGGGKTAPDAATGTTTLDAGDAGPGDGGRSDGGGVVDAGDAGQAVIDSGTVDGGTTAPSDAGDAGLVDAGDAGPPPFVDAGPVGCIDVSSNTDPILWQADTTPVSLPGDQGRLVRCYHTGSYGILAATAQASPWLVEGVTVQNGYHEYVIQYVSQSPPGTVRHVTALLYLPDTGASKVLLVSVGHATSGVGPSCGVTHQNIYADYMALPLVTQGYAVVATDYPGMGIDDGVSPYGVAQGESDALLDAAKAVTQIHDPGRFDAAQLSLQLMLMGHSQGGHAVLSAQQRFDPDSGFDLLGSVSFAPAFGDLRGEEFLVQDGGGTTVDDAFLMSMSLYAQSAFYGTPADSSWLTSAGAAELPGVLHDQCLTTAQSQIEADFPIVSDLFSPSLISGMGSCSLDGGPCASFDPFTTYFNQSVPGNFASTAPVLILQGEADETVWPETTACIKQRLDNNGTPEQVCAYASATHVTIEVLAIGDALKWVAGRVGGTVPNVCSAALKETCLPDGPTSPNGSED